MRDNLLGRDPATALDDARSPLLHVSPDTPPCFLVDALDDGTVPVEAHFFTEGGHGFGLHLSRDQSGSRWPDLLALWMRKHNG